VKYLHRDRLYTLEQCSEHPGLCLVLWAPTPTGTVEHHFTVDSLEPPPLSHQ